MQILLVVQIIISISLIAAVLMQSSGGGLGAAFGGSASFHTKRGVEKGLFYLTIVLAILFTLASIFSIVFYV